LLKIAIIGSHVLKRGVERRLPMICANPDERAMLPDGTLGHMPGAIAAEYSRLGGQVVMFGKPDRKHFDASKSLLTSSIAADAASNGHAAPPVRFLHVGDSLHHDIAGASNAEVDSLFIGGGIHASTLGLGEGGEGELEEARVFELQEKVGIKATYASRLFVW
jgi:ribonucleotide monophosphatase NagD (HAD superfamily)